MTVSSKPSTFVRRSLNSRSFENRSVRSMLILFAAILTPIERAVRRLHSVARFSDGDGSSGGSWARVGMPQRDAIKAQYQHADRREANRRMCGELVESLTSVFLDSESDCRVQSGRRFRGSVIHALSISCRSSYWRSRLTGLAALLSLGESVRTSSDGVACDSLDFLFLGRFPGKELHQRCGPLFTSLLAGLMPQSVVRSLGSSTSWISFLSPL